MRRRKNPEPEVFPTHGFFKALCDPNRLSIFKWLTQCATSKKVGDITQCCDVDGSVVSRHLSLMKQAGLLTSEKRGKEVYYSINSGSVSQVLRNIADYLEACCPFKDKKDGRKR